MGELASRMVAMGNDVTIYNRRDDFVSEAEGGGAADGNFIWKGVHVLSTPTINKAGLAAVSSSFTATLSAIIHSLHNYDKEFKKWLRQTW